MIPDPHAAVTLDAEHRAVWLCFESSDGRERRRLTLAEAPTDWDALPDDRLELLRRVATVSAPPLLDGPPGAIAST